MANITGNNQANVLNGTLGNDLVKGKGGNDEIDGGAGDDRLKGGGGADTITDGEGLDRMWGGSGADTFVLVAGDGERDQIKDWESQDTIDLSAWSVHDISELIFQTLGNGQIRVKFGNEELQIKAKGGATLTEQDFDASDFIFAPTPVYNTIDFESFDTQNLSHGDLIESADPGHGGLTWSTQFYFAEADEIQLDGYASGLDNRTSSGDNVGINGFAMDVSVSAADNFDFEKMSAGALYNENLVLEITGKDDGVIKGTQTVILSTQSTSVIELDDAIFNSVDEVEFASSGGTIHPDFLNRPIAPDSTHFYIDDMLVG